MYCTNCGFNNKSGSNFCSECGNKLIVSENVIKSGNKETSLVLGIICLCSSLFINILCFVPGIISMVYAFKYKKESGKLGTGFGLSLGGMILSIVILIISIILIWLFISVGSGYNYVDPGLDNINVDYSDLYNM